MAGRQYLVRRYVHHSDRTVVLPDSGQPPSPRNGDYDDYERPRPATPARPAGPWVPLAKPPVVSRQECPECGRTVRFNDRTQIFYSHNLPDGTSVCKASGRSRPLENR